MASRVTNCKVALFDIDFRKVKLGLAMSVVTNDPKKLQEIQDRLVAPLGQHVSLSSARLCLWRNAISLDRRNVCREADITKERIQMILAAGVNVVCTTKGIDDAALKYFISAGAIAVRRVAKDDMRRLSKSTGG